MAKITTVNWQIPPNNVSKNLKGVDVWHFDLSKSLCTPSFLDKNEKKRLDGLTNKVVYQQYCTSHTLLRQTLGRYLDCAASEVQITIPVGGKPLLASKSQPLHFNLSHSGDFALIAVSNSFQVGVDIEPERTINNISRIAQKALSAADLAYLEQNNWKKSIFFNLWTKMEARQKCLGEGIFGGEISADLVKTYDFMVAADIYAAVAWENKLAACDLNFYSHY